MTEGVQEIIDECQIERAEPLRLNPKRYQTYLDEMQIPEDQAQEFLETLWNMMRVFVDIGFGLDSVQIFTEHIQSQLKQLDAEFQESAQRALDQIEGDQE